MKEILNKFKLAKATLVYLKNPQNVDSVLNLGDQLKNKPLTITQENLKTLKNMYTENYGLSDIKLEQLSQMPKGSLGYEYFNYLKKNNLDPNFYKYENYKAPTGLPEYIKIRLRQTHDLWHLITGFDTSEEGEAGLIAFYYAQLKSNLSGYILCLSFVHFARKRREELPLLLDEITRGWALGKKAHALIAVKWEEHWEQPLKDLKLSLNLKKS